MSKYQYVCKTCGAIMDHSLGHLVSTFSSLPYIIDAPPPQPFERGTDILHCPVCYKMSGDYSVIEYVSPA